MKIEPNLKVYVTVIAVCLLAFRQGFAEDAEEVSAKTIAEIKRNYEKWKGKIIKFNFCLYRSVVRIVEDRYWGYLYDENMQSIYAEFDEEGKHYVKKAKGWGESLTGDIKSQNVYAKIRIQKTKHRGVLENTMVIPSLVLIGSKKHEKDDGNEYGW